MGAGRLAHRRSPHLYTSDCATTSASTHGRTRWGSSRSILGRPNDANNIQPRFGFAYQWNERTIVRGGSGLHYADALTIDAFWPYYNEAQLARPQYSYDGRADFATNPLNGQPLPTFDEAQALFCNSPQQAEPFAAWQSRKLRHRALFVEYVPGDAPAE